MVLAGGIFAAVAGPELARIGGPLFEKEFLGAFVGLAVVAGFAAILLTQVRGTDRGSVRAAGEAARPLRVIIAEPIYIVALFGAVTAYGVMILAMTATPLAMVNHNHDLIDASRVIQAHVLGMFIPSFFAGGLIARFGVLPVMTAGIGVLGTFVLMTLTGAGFAGFLVALALLGLGWNLLFVGATTLLTKAYRASERARAQAANDLTIFAVGLLTSLVAGALLEALGWQLMNALLLPWLATAAGLILWLAAPGRGFALRTA